MDPTCHDTDSFQAIVEEVQATSSSCWPMFVWHIIFCMQPSHIHNTWVNTIILCIFYIWPMHVVRCTMACSMHRGTHISCSMPLSQKTDIALGDAHIVVGILKHAVST